MKDRIITILFCVALVLLVITLSIGLPIYCRFFYYIQINTLNLVQETGGKYNYAQIKAAYDEVLNYLTLPWCEFGTGEMAHSESGAAHFADCKKLFNLNLIIMLCSAAVVAGVLIAKKFKKIKLTTFFNRGATFWSGVSVFALIFIIAILVLTVDFNKAFKIFHTIFFPGKTNWVFNPRTDEIILVMPQRFFMNCAIFIAVGIFTFSSALIAADFLIPYVKKRRAKTAN
ncbi:MAG: TIGR01906 family membrane protein [Clostridia bacterium]|nr:TIGR01906 family membrane protein [Clostridia bacterium]